MAESSKSRSVCLATREVDGRTLICRKSSEHTESSIPTRREHYDNSANERWTDEEASDG